MPTTTYTNSTFSANVIGARTDSAGAGVTDFSAEEARFFANLLSEGYLTPSTGFKVQAQSSPDMTVKIGSGTAKADYYCVAGEVSGQGNYIVRLDVASQNVTISAADASQARTDEVYLVVRDNIYDASARALPQIGYRKGDIGGAAPGPDAAWKASVKLATIAVAAGATTITSANITDNRAASLFSVIPANLQLALASFFLLAMSTRQTGDANERFAIYADGFHNWGSGASAVDTNLYRASANVLKTDDEFQANALGIANNMGFIGGPVVTKVDALRMRINAALDVYGNLDLRAADKIFFEGDTNLYRKAANVLATDDAMSILGELFLDSGTAGVTFGGGGQPTRIHRTASNTLKVDSDWHVEDSLFVDGNGTVSGDLSGGKLVTPSTGVIGFIGGSRFEWFNSGTIMTSGSLKVLGNFDVAGAKAFRIPHPTDKSMDLVHGCTESPHNGVEYWGTAAVVDGSAEVELPHYFEALTRQDGRVVFLTPIVAGDDVVPVIAATRVVDGRFRIVAGAGAPAQFDVDWQVKAVRADLPELETEQPRSAPEAA